MSVAQMLAHCAMTVEMALARAARCLAIRWSPDRRSGEAVVAGERQAVGNARTHPSVLVEDNRYLEQERGRLERQSIVSRTADRVRARGIHISFSVR